MTTHNVGITASVNTSEDVSARVKHNFSKQHLRAAIFFAAEAQTTETAIQTPDETQRSQHRAHVTAAVLSAVAFLEASINELYLSAINQDLASLPSFDAYSFQLFAQFWEDVEKYPILHKYQVALALSRKDRFDRGSSPYQEAESLVKLRDCLVHYKPEWDDDLGHHQKLEDRLKGRFALNPYGAESPLWFPHQCLGAGCATWSVTTARTFSDEFCKRLAIPDRTT